MERTEITSQQAYDEQRAAIKTALACGKRVVVTIEDRGEDTKSRPFIVFYAEEPV